MNHSTHTSLLTICVTANELVVLESAALQSRMSVNDYIRHKALEAVGAEAFDHQPVTIPADAWAKFESWGNEPAKDVPALRKLAVRALHGRNAHRHDDSARDF